MGLSCCSRKVFPLQGKRLGASPPGFQQANVGLSAQGYFTTGLKIVSSGTQYRMCGEFVLFYNYEPRFIVWHDFVLEFGIIDVPCLVTLVFYRCCYHFGRFGGRSFMSFH